MSRLFVILLLSVLTLPLVGATAENATAANSSADNSAQIKKMQEQMQAMAAEMVKIQATTDPAVRQQLMQQHMQNMVAFMGAMHAACGTDAQWGCSAGPGMMGDSGGHMMGGAYGAGSDARLNAIDQRLDLLTQMVDQLVQHEQASGAK